MALGGYVNEAQGPDTANVVMRVIRPEAGVAFLLYENRLLYQHSLLTIRVCVYAKQVLRTACI